MANAKKEYPAWHYFLAAGLAFPVGILFTFFMFQIIMGPGMLIASIVFLVIGIKKARAKDVQPSPPV